MFEIHVETVLFNGDGSDRSTTNKTHRFDYLSHAQHSFEGLNEQFNSSMVYGGFDTEYARVEVRMMLDGKTIKFEDHMNY